MPKPEIRTFTECVDKTDRSKDPVHIMLETVGLETRRPVTRPVSVWGLVIPIKTKGRPSAPEGISGQRVSQTPDKSATDLHYLNTGMSDMDKGHIFALSLGGPDVSENIVAQYSHFQRTQEWRRLERETEKLARQQPKTRYFYQVNLHYSTSESFSRSAQPEGFSVFVFDDAKRDVPLRKLFVPNNRDIRDDRHGNKELNKIDGLPKDYMVRDDRIPDPKREVDLTRTDRPPVPGQLPATHGDFYGEMAKAARAEFKQQVRLAMKKRALPDSGPDSDSDDEDFALPDDKRVKLDPKAR